MRLHAVAARIYLACMWFYLMLFLSVYFLMALGQLMLSTTVTTNLSGHAEQ